LEFEKYFMVHDLMLQPEWSCSS